MFRYVKKLYARLAAGDAETYPARMIADEEMGEQPWTHTVDIAVIGCGGAGVVAALEAREHGADVLVIERLQGGGSTKISGGIYYAGAGTPIQTQAGIDDSPDNMFNYLRQETGAAVSQQTLRRFCEQSPDNLAWLTQHGVPFDAALCPYKTSYPSNDYYLYYSGNEPYPPYSDKAVPAARGHRAHGKGVSGAVFFAPLMRSALATGVNLLTQHKAIRLLCDHRNAVIGVEVRAMRPGSPSALLHRFIGLLMVFLRYATIFTPVVTHGMRWCVEALERRYAATSLVRARKGVIISSGGFYFNRNMVAQYAPRYLSGVPLGTIGDNGSGIKLGQSVGGQTGFMESISAWRFINPPQAFVHGVLVDSRGNRLCNEMLYGAQLSERIMKNADGKAWLIIDRALFRQAHRELGPRRAMWFQSVSALMFLYLARRRAASLDALARKLEIPADTLQRTIAEYNALAGSEQPDPMGKPAEFCRALEVGPYYALDCSADSLLMCPALSLGGLRVDEDSGAVLSGDNTTITGLYAAGRSAVGVASQSYVSGLSLADCIFSGRRAGRHAAERAASAR